jgi:hypothetical protein
MGSGCTSIDPRFMISSLVERVPVWTVWSPELRPLGRQARNQSLYCAIAALRENGMLHELFLRAK